MESIVESAIEAYKMGDSDRARSCLKSNDIELLELECPKRPFENISCEELIGVGRCRFKSFAECRGATFQHEFPEHVTLMDEIFSDWRAMGYNKSKPRV